MTTTGQSTETPGNTACWLCTQHSTRLEHHNLETDHYPVRECASAAGTGVDLCPMCHTAVHNWMRAHGTADAGAARAGLEAVLHRFTTAVLA